jgi:hypothetical protein
MATVKYFNGRKVILPGVYSTIKSGVNNPPQINDYGTCLIIDTGKGATYGGGGSINGEHTSGQDAIYTFSELKDFQSFQKGGILWKTAEALFKPDGQNVGISQLIFVRAATTTGATMTFSPVGGGANGGTFAFDTLDEGLITNGVLDVDNNNNLIKGYAFTVESGIVDVNKWIFKVWLGTYVGDHTDGFSYDESLQVDSKPALIVQSPEFDNVQELIDWSENDPDFRAAFVPDPTNAIAGDGSVDATDAATAATYQVAAGGTETYGTSDLTDVLEAVKELKYPFILSDAYGSSDYNTASVGAIQSHIESDAVYGHYMYYGGGKDKSEFGQTDGSIPQTAYFDSNKVIVCHGDVKKASNVDPTGFRIWPTLYKAANILGRIAGLPPQVPGTFKSIGIDGEVHKLTTKERETALQAGVLTTYFDTDFNNFIITQAVNTLQNNTNVINADGRSFSIQLERIKAQINTDVVVNAKIQLLGQPNGVNRNTLSANYVKNWTERFLETKKATPSDDNLIISYQDVTVKRVQDYWEVTYGIVPNNEITKLFFTGTILDI